jgi:copper chaperone
MTCSGCSGAVDRVLKKTEGELHPLLGSPNSLLPRRLPTGVSSYDISLDKQEVLVTTTVPYDDILAKIKKTGKEVKSGETISA